jgi:hypothetical protein
MTRSGPLGTEVATLVQPIFLGRLAPAEEEPMLHPAAIGFRKQLPKRLENGRLGAPR